MWWNQRDADTGTIGTNEKHASLRLELWCNTADICETPPSVRGRLASALTFSGLSPPREIVGEAGKRVLKSLSGLTHGLAARAQHAGDRADGECAGNDHHTHLGKRSMPKGARPGA